MCCCDVTNNRRARRIYLLANLCLVLGLLPRIFVSPQLFHAHLAVDFFSGLFLGCSIVMHFRFLLLRRRSRQS